MSPLARLDDRGLLSKGALERPADARLIAYPHPFASTRVTGPIPHGWTIDEIVGELVGERHLNPALIRSLRVWVWREDSPLVGEIPFAAWRRVRPRPGTVVLVKCVPLGGGGGGGKSPLRLIAGLAVMAVAAFAGPALFAALPAAAQASFVEFGLGLGLSFGQSLALGGTLLGGAVSLVGNAVLNAIIPPSLPSARSLAGGSFSLAPLSPPTFSITGVRNQANPYGPIPRVFGTRRVFPVLAARLHTENQGNDQYVRGLFCFGEGPLAISDIRIGETPIAAFSGVETEVRQGYPADAPTTLYSRSVREETLNVLLTAAGGWQGRTTLIDTTEISVDVTFGRGLTKFNSSGGRDPQTVAIEVEYRAAGSGGAFTVAGTIAATDNATSAVRRDLRVQVASGQYEVRLRRTTADATEASVVDLATWTALRSITTEHPIALSGLALLAVRIKASEQLNGVLDQVNAVCSSILPVWNGSSWSEAETRNPAWAFAAVLRGAANSRPYADSEIDLPGLLAWANACDAASPQADGPMWTYDAVHDRRSTVDATLREIAASARASFVDRGGKASVVRDVAQVVPMQHFTPRNSGGFKATRLFVDHPHGLKCRFVNPDRGWQEDEVVVYADGYTAATATVFEQIDMMACTRSVQAWRDGRYQMAVAKLRPASYELTADVEYLACGVGDLVRVAYDVPVWGLGAARLASVVVDGGGNATSLVLDAPVTIEPGLSYAVRIRRSNNSSVVATVTGPSGSTATLTPTPAIPAASAPAAGDLVMFGEVGQDSIECLVKTVGGGADLSARLTLVDAAPAVHASYAGTIPAFASQIPASAQASVQLPPRPAVLAVRSDESALVREIDGSLTPRIVISLGPIPAGPAAVEAIEVQWREVSGTWKTPSRVPPSATEASVAPVDQGLAYDLRLRSIGTLGRASEWVEVLAHTVVGKASPPPAVTHLMLHGSALTWPYPAPPPDLDGFRVVYNFGVNRNRAGAIPAHPGSTVIAAPPFDISGLPGGTLTVLVMAVDTSGNESAVPAVLVQDMGDVAVANIVETLDRKALGWPGTIAGGTVVSGDVAANDNGAVFWKGPADSFWGADTAVFWPALTYVVLTYDDSVVPDPAWVPVDMTLQATVQGDAYAIDYRRQGLELFWRAAADLFWDANTALFWPALPPFMAWPGVLRVGREKIEIKVSTVAGPQRGMITALKAIFDVDDVEEEFTGFGLASGGTRLTLAKPFRVVKDVHTSLLSDGGTAETVRIVDKLVSPGPLVRAFDGANAGAAGTINAKVVGY